MKAQISRLFTALLLSSMCSYAMPASLPTPAAPVLAAKGYILVDAQSHKILAAKNADEPLEPASLTKLMTAYITSKAFHDGSLNTSQLIPISKKAWKMPGSRMFVEVGTHVKAYDLLQGVIIQSGNDASVALAEAIAGSEGAFATLMNEEAKRLGMTQTHFANASGLPNPDHYTSAHDLALLSNAVIHDFPEFYDLYSRKWFSYNNIKQPNRNRLLWTDSYVDGLKTGQTDSAGYCLAATAAKDDMRLISIVIGSQSEEQRAKETRQLLSYGFRYFETRTFYEKQSALKQQRVWMGNTNLLPIGLAEDLTLTLPRGQSEKLQAELHLAEKLQAPLHQGQQVGSLVISLEGTLIAERPLLALTDVAAGGMWRKLQDYVELTFSSLFASETNKESS